MNPAQPPPDALLLLAPGCPHCHGVLEGLSGLVKEGMIGRLEVVNAAVHPERAQALGVKTVPWTRIGPFELEGALSPAELRQWAQSCGSPGGLADYFFHMLKAGRRGKVEALLRDDPSRGQALVRLLERADASMAVRLGIGAVLEELRGSDATQGMIPGLGALARQGDALTRADACHFLSLIGGAEAVPCLRACLEDADEGVRETAREALADLSGAP